MMLEDFGMMTEPMPENRVQYDLRALDKYCSERKILPIDLSEEELKKFELPIDLSEEELKKFELPKDKSVANF